MAGRFLPWGGVLLAASLGTLLLLEACTTREVVGVVVSEVRVQPENPRLLEGESRQFQASVIDDRGRTLPQPTIEWLADPATSLEIDETGMARAVQADTVEVRARYDGVTGTTSVVILAPPSIVIDTTVASLYGSPRGPGPRPAVIEVTNGGQVELIGLSAAVAYADGAPDGWLTTDVGPEAPTDLTLTADVADLEVGTYEATVTLSSDEDTATVAVELSVADFTISETGSSTGVTESGGLDTVSVRLDLEPDTTVVLDVASTDTMEIAVSPDSLVFEPSDWDVPQLVTITGRDGAFSDGDQSAAVRLSVDTLLSDPRYRPVPPDSVQTTVFGFLLDETDGGTSVTEAGGTDTVTVVLGAAPTTEVVVRVTSDDPDEVVVSPDSVVFTADDWDVPQSVVATGVDDSVDDGDQSTAVRFMVDAALSDDAFDELLEDSVVVSTVNDDMAGLTVGQSNGGTLVNEGGGTDSLTVALGSQPLSDVVLTLFSSDTTEARVDPTSLTFTPGNWNVEQEVEVSGVDDIDFDGNQSSLIVVAVLDAVSDSTYAADVDDETVSVTTIDDDADAGFAIDQVATSVPEGSTTPGFSVVLTTQPPSDVVLDIVSDDPAVVTASSPSLTFDASNWNVQQVVSVTGTDDDLIDGNQSTTLTVSVDTLQSDPTFRTVPDSAITVIAVDDDVAGVLLADTGSVVVNESGTTDDFTVRLTAEPAGPVIFSVESDDLSAATVSVDSLTFTAANWNTPQDVTVTGVDDDLTDGDQPSTVTLAVDAARSDDAFDGILPSTINVTTTDDDQPGYRIDHTGGFTQVAEAGTIDSLLVVLTAQPASVVTLDAVSGDPGEAAVPTDSLVFTTFDWNVPQYVIVTGVDDGGLVDGNQTTSISVAVDPALTDADFAGLPAQSLSVLTADDDQPGFSVDPTGPGSSVSETGTSDSLAVVLTGQPVGQVVLDVAAGAADEVGVSPAQLTFTAANWSATQYVVLTGVDDGALVDGDQTTQVTVTVDQASSDDAFDGLAAQSQSVTTLDDDVAGFAVDHTADSTVVSENGTTDSISVVLTAQPENDVVFDVSSDDENEATAAPPQLTFANGNWNTPQFVVVTGVDDGLEVDGNEQTTIEISVNAGATDPAFDGLASQGLTVTTTDNDFGGFTLTPTNGATDVTEAGSTDSLSVELTAQPTSDVVFDVTSDDEGEAVVSPAQLTFSPAQWNQSQVIVVTGVDDALIDGNQSTVVTVSVNNPLSADAFDGLSEQESVTTADDDIAGITLADTASTTVTEAGGVDPFVVRLDAEPFTQVVLSVTSGDPTEAVSDSTAVTFTSANWNTGVQVPVRGVDDFIVDGTQASVITLTVDDANSDDAFDGLPPVMVDVATLDDDVADLDVNEIGGTTVNEGGSTDNFTVALTAEPETDVVIGVTSLDLDEVTVNPDTLTFTAADWSDPQTVTVTGVDDDEADGDQTTPIAIVVDPARSDPDFDSLTDTVNVTTQDDDGVGILINEVGSTWVTEDGTKPTDEFEVSLTSAPATPVVVSVTSNDMGEVTVAAASAPLDSLTFTSGTWSVPQTVTVSGVDDVIVDGDVQTTVSVAVDPARSDDQFDTVTVRTVNAETRDDDVPGFTLTDTLGLTTTETGGTATFEVVLNREPLSDVVLDIVPSDPSEVSAVSSSVTFTPSNWNTQQTVNLAGEDDSIDDGDVLSTVSVSLDVGASDPLWSGVGDQDVSVTNTDDDDAGITVSAISGPTSEPNGTATFTVVLDSEPTADVSIDVSSDDTSEGLVTDPVGGTLTFTAANWETPQTVTVTGQDDDVDDGDVGYSIVTDPAVSADSDYNTLDANDVSVTNTDDDTAGITVSAISGPTSEPNGTATFTVILDSEPTADVSIDVSSDDTSEGLVTDPVGGTLTFTAANWETPQTVTVTGQDDDVDDGDVGYSIVTDPAVSADSDYNALDANDVSVTNTDDDTAGITVTPTTGLTTTESGGTAQFTVVLDSEPVDTVTIGISSSDTSEGTLSTSTLTFTAVDWNIQQTVTVTGVDDDVEDGDVGYMIVTDSASAGGATNYDGFDVDDVSVTNTDDDVAGVTVSAISGPTTEAGPGSATFTVVLDSEPTADVTIELASSDASEGQVTDPAGLTLTFTAGNWQTAQPVTVEGVDDTFADGNVGYTIVTDSATSADPNYDGFDAADVAVTNTDDETAGWSVVERNGDTVVEEGNSDPQAIDVQLTEQPETDVVITVDNGDPSEIALDTTQLTFTPANWNVVQSVIVTSVDDGIADGSQETIITLSVDPSSPAPFAALDDVTVTATTLDNDQ